jgi:hypothetical protein
VKNVYFHVTIGLSDLSYHYTILHQQSPIGASVAGKVLQYEIVSLAAVRSATPIFPTLWGFAQDVNIFDEMNWSKWQAVLRTKFEAARTWIQIS